MKWLVVTDGAGEDKLNWNVVEVEAGNATAALNKAIDPRQGYGDKLALVVAVDDVHSFELVERLVPQPLDLNRITENALHRLSDGF